MQTRLSVYRGGKSFRRIISVVEAKAINTGEERMKIDAQYGRDTGMYLVDVYLESDHECALSHNEIWAALPPLLAAEGVEVVDVVDFVLYCRNPHGK